MATKQTRKQTAKVHEEARDLAGLTYVNKDISLVNIQMAGKIIHALASYSPVLGFFNVPLAILAVGLPHYATLSHLPDFCHFRHIPKLFELAYA